MTIKELSLSEKNDAEIFAALQNLILVEDPHNNRILLLTRKEALEEVKSKREQGRNDDAYRLLALTKSDSKSFLNDIFSQTSTKSYRINSTTMFKLRMTNFKTELTRSDCIKRLLGPTLSEFFNKHKKDISDENARTIEGLYNKWIRTKRKKTSPRSDEQDLKEIQEEDHPEQSFTFLFDGFVAQNITVPACSFIGNLLRLMNFRPDGEFYYPPEAIERYLDRYGYYFAKKIVSFQILPEMGNLSINFMSGFPAELVREANDDVDFLRILEFLVLEWKYRKFKNFEFEVKGKTEKEQKILMDLKNLETSYFKSDDPLVMTKTAVPSLSESGREQFRAGIQKLSKVEFVHRLGFSTQIEEDDGTWTKVPGSIYPLMFKIDLTPDGESFTLDGIIATYDKSDEMQKVIHDKLMTLAKCIYGRIWKFERPIIEGPGGKMETTPGARDDEPDDRIINEMMRNFVVLEFYKSIDELSKALADDIIFNLMGSQVISLTIPRVLLAFLNAAMKDKNIDELIVKGLTKNLMKDIQDV